MHIIQDMNIVIVCIVSCLFKVVNYSGREGKFLLKPAEQRKWNVVSSSRFISKYLRQNITLSRKPLNVIFEYLNICPFFDDKSFFFNENSTKLKFIEFFVQFLIDKDNFLFK